MERIFKFNFYFGIYLLIIGLFNIILPNLLLNLFRYSTTQEVWIRVLGLMLVILGIYYVYLCTKRNKEFLYISCFGRMLILPIFFAFYLSHLASWQLLLLGFIDSSTGSYTLWKIKQLKLIDHR